MKSIHSDRPSKRLNEFFYWFVRRAFQDLQIQNQAAAEYLAGLLVYFCHAEMLYSLRNAQGEKLETVVGMLLEATWAESQGEDRSQTRARELYKHIGDYIMFITGLFKEYVERLGCLGLYFREGERAYQFLFQFDLEHFKPGAALFLELSRRFEFYSGSLHYLRKTFFRDPEPHDPFADFSLQLAQLN